MDTSAKNIKFNDDGICNYCSEFENKLNLQNIFKKNIDTLLKKIKKIKILMIV